jgi:hypothetical protein
MMIFPSMLALISSRGNEAAKKMPSFSEEEEIHRYTEGVRIVVKTGAAPPAQNESATGFPLDGAYHLSLFGRTML